MSRSCGGPRSLRRRRRRRRPPSRLLRPRPRRCRPRTSRLLPRPRRVPPQPSPLLPRMYRLLLSHRPRCLPRRHRLALHVHRLQRRVVRQGVNGIRGRRRIAPCRGRIVLLGLFAGHRCRTIDRTLSMTSYRKGSAAIPAWRGRVSRASAVALGAVVDTDVRRVACRFCPPSAKVKAWSRRKRCTEHMMRAREVFPSGANHLRPASSRVREEDQGVAVPVEKTANRTGLALSQTDRRAGYRAHEPDKNTRPLICRREDVAQRRGTNCSTRPQTRFLKFVRCSYHCQDHSKRSFPNRCRLRRAGKGHPVAHRGRSRTRRAARSRRKHSGETATIAACGSILDK